ncbi:MAG: phage holin family protein [Candidatus Eremiobacteraeota bacterium]|nr:phage holin family protein [Candidatus Eremiobacteraeota bacterium]
MHFLIRLVINAIVFYLIATYIPGFSIHSGNILITLLIAALIFGLVNAIIRPIVLLLTLPLNIVTLGLFTIIINALMFWLTIYLVPGFSVAGFVPALEGSIVMMIISLILSHIFTSERRAA